MAGVRDDDEIGAGDESRGASQRLDGDEWVRIGGNDADRYPEVLQTVAEIDAVARAKGAMERGLVHRGAPGDEPGHVLGMDRGPARVPDGAGRFMLDLPPDDPDVIAGKPLHLPATAGRWASPTSSRQCRTISPRRWHCRSISARPSPWRSACPRGYFEPYYQRPLVQLSLLHYRPPASLREEDIEIGAGEHRDTGAFTLLMQDDTGGLEVQRKDGEWIGAPPVKGAYVINIGNVMMRWTNGRFVSTPHRVVNRA